MSLFNKITKQSVFFGSDFEKIFDSTFEGLDYIYFLKRLHENFKHAPPDGGACFFML
jgi:hypothetical protein